MFYIIGDDTSLMSYIIWAGDQIGQNTAIHVFQTMFGEWSAAVLCISDSERKTQYADETNMFSGCYRVQYILPQYILITFQPPFSISSDSRPPFS